MRLRQWRISPLCLENMDKLLFNVLNSGDAFAGISPEMLQNSNSLSVKVCEKGLRYDLTVPFARFVVQHQNELVFPFKRYPIQPVWRADRPQQGRYRVFYQCDVDVVGSDSLINELELVQIVDEVFSHLGLSVAVKINNRKVLSGIAEVTGHADKLIDITVAIDKIDKIGIDAVKDELRSKGIDDKAIAIIEPILSLSGTTKEKLSEIRVILSKSETGNKGVDELEELFNLIESAGVTCNTELDLSLARGLNYYTGAIFEVKSLETAMGSICGGGRYDDLTGIFGLKGVSGVGISFGADRIYDVISALDRFPKDAVEGTKVLFTNMGKRELLYTIPIVKQLREAGVPAEIYTDEVKLKKQFDYAEKRGIPFLAIIGEDEVTNSKISLKNLSTGEQKNVDKQDIVRCFKN